MDGEHLVASAKDDKPKLLLKLPLELQLEILCLMPDLVSLKSLITAATVFHITYVRYKEAVLRAVFINDLGDVVVDIIYVMKARVLLPELDSDVQMEGVVEFVDDYTKEKELNDPSSLLAVCAPETLIGLLKFHEKIMALVTLYTKSMALELPIRVNAFLDDESWTLSTTERRRITRAFYRFELLTQVLSVRTRAVESTLGTQLPRDTSADKYHISRFSEQDLLCRIICKFNFWEIEEISCVRDWVDFSYHSLFKKLKSQSRTHYWHTLTKEVVCAGFPIQRVTDGTELCVCGACNFNDPCFYGEYYARYKTAFILSGLGQFLSISTASETEMLRLICEQMDKFLPDPGNWFPVGLPDTDVFLHDELDMLMERIWYSAPNWTREEPDYHSEHFAGDCTSKPNAAWVWSQEESVADLERKSVPGGPWGYVMWDKSRLDKLHVESLRICQNRNWADVTDYQMGLTSS